MNNNAASGRNFSALHVLLMVVLTVVISVVITTWIILADVFVTEFNPVELNKAESQALAGKMRKLGVDDLHTDLENTHVLTPEPYSESEESRVVKLTEREVNALLANNTDLANKLAIDLSENLASVKFLMPLDDDLPVLGGKTLKVTAGVELDYTNQQPVVIIKGISVWGVPIPGAYLGDIKNVDLINEFGESGFWKSFADGLDDLSVNEGEIHIKLTK